MKRERNTTILELTLPSDPVDGLSEHSEANLRTHNNEVREASGRSRADGVTIGTLAGFEDSGAPLVLVPGSGEKPLKSLSTVILDRTVIGRAVVLQFEGADPHKPVILGVIQGPLDAVVRPADTAAEALQKNLNVELDGERLVVTADKEIVLRCGKSSITLTRAGKVLIRGAYLLSRSSGVNRIKGGSVQIN